MLASRGFLAMAAGFVAGIAALGACFGTLHWLLLPERFPVGEVRILGELKRSPASEIHAALPRARGNFFVADLAEVRAGIERLPWVRRVAVRRVWPGRLEVSVEEHVALARWGDDALVNTYGERFFAKAQQSLPAFVAPAGTEAEVALRYLRFAAIVAPLGTAVERVVLTPRLAWQLRLANGLHLMLGRDADAAEVRLRRFAEIYPEMRQKTPLAHEYVDLRYPNGFALRLPEFKS